MSNEPGYEHTQRAPLCVLLYAIAAVDFALVWAVRNQPPMQWLFLVVGLFMLVVAGSFHFLTVRDRGDRLFISFGPLPLFRRLVRYDEIAGVELGRTTWLDGWGIHRSLRGGWVWNLWGRDCVVLRLKKGTLRIGSDDSENLVDFLRSRVELADH